MIYTSGSDRQAQGRWCRGATSAAWCPARRSPELSRSTHPPVVPAAVPRGRANAHHLLPGVHRPAGQLWRIHPHRAGKTCGEVAPTMFLACRASDRTNARRQSASSCRRPMGPRARAVCQGLRRLPAPWPNKPRRAWSLGAAAALPPATGWCSVRCRTSWPARCARGADWRRAHST